MVYYHVQKPSRMKCTGKLDPCFWRKEKRIHREQAQHEAEETLENQWKSLDPLLPWNDMVYSARKYREGLEGLEVIRMTELNQPSNGVNLALRLPAGLYSSAGQGSVLESSKKTRKSHVRSTLLQEFCSSTFYGLFGSVLVCSYCMLAILGSWICYSHSLSELLSCELHHEWPLGQ